MAGLSKEQREKMFAAWCNKPTCYSVAKISGVSENTVHKYRDKDNWIERAAAVHRKVSSKGDNEVAKRLARHINLSQLLQKKGFDALQGSEAKKAVDVKTAFEARQLIVDGVKLEREVLGDSANQPSEININVVYVKGEVK